MVRRDHIKVVFVNLVVFAALFALIEFSARVYGYIDSPGDELRITNFAKSDPLVQDDRWRGEKHPILGYVPQAGVHGVNTWAKEPVSIGDAGIRSNGASRRVADRPLTLAVGDSFTFGDGVGDDQTWPAHLEELAEARVVNAGVPGYGVDQAVLRAEILAARFRPDVIVLGLIHDDILRAEMAVRAGVYKPTFAIENGELRLTLPTENEAVYGKRYDSWRRRLEPLRAVLGYSFVVHHVMHRLFPEFWISGDYSIRAHDDGLAVSCRLMSRFAAIPRARKALLIEYTPHEIRWDARPADLDALARCAEAEGIEVVDVYPTLKRTIATGKADLKDLYSGHMSAEGNRLVAEILYSRARWLMANASAAGGTGRHDAYASPRDSD
jgi:GDSL-like Lipase/Acylhydrolase family